MKIIVIFFIFLFSASLSAQDIHFSMPYSSWMNLNPSFAGSKGCNNSLFGYRNQWPNISGSFVTSVLSYDQYVKILHGGIGVNFSHDRAGSFRSSRFSGIYSAHIPVLKRKFIFSPSLEGAYVEKRIDWSTSIFGNNLSPYGFIYNPTGIVNDFVSYPDFSAGFLVYNEKYNAGFTASHLTEPDEGFYSTSSRLPMKYVAHFGANIGDIDSAKSFSFSPSVVFSSQQDFRSLLISCAAKYDKYLIGIGYRNYDAIIASVGFRNKIIRVSYSYDITVSKLGIVTAGSHELSFSFMFNRKYRPENFLGFSTAAF